MATITQTRPSPRISEHVERVQINCNLCNSQHLEPFCPENERGLVKCCDCGLVFVGARPQPEELYALYNETYFQNDESGEVGYTDYIADEANIRKTSHRRLKHIEKYHHPAKLLDIGCAMGFFIDTASQRGWQVEGMDVSSFATQYTTEHFGHKTYTGDLTRLALESDSYDTISMFDVIEHVPDPRAYIAEVARLLKTGGVVEIMTPDVGSLPARLTGKRWIGYKLSDEHVYYFDIKTLSRMLQEEGFEVLHVRHIGKYVTLSLFLDRMGFYLPFVAKPLSWLEKRFGISRWSLYVNPFDIMAITARKTKTA